MYRAIVVEDAHTEDRSRPHRASVQDREEHELAPGDVTIAVEYSSVNYKDALALDGRPGVIRTPPLVPGIDVVGTVTHAEGAALDRFDVGDRVVLNGAGLGERVDGGLAERARVDSAALLRLPDRISSRRAASIGTAGFTAMLSILALEKNGVHPDAGAVLVTGSAGGVGSIAIAVLAKLGYTVTASTGRAEEQGDYLRRLGAAEIVDRAEFQEAGKPLQKARWAGVVDTVGSHTLANVLAQTVWGGTVTACGLAQGADLPGSVMPFILRGVTLCGINSVEAPLASREQAWDRLASDLDFALLDELTEEMALAEAITVAPEVLAGHVRGRTVVDVRY
ncbi:oxidoreductase [Microbacteriaceae bacterium VKM Ac-2854]|nr:oxidoreductase [Microbacteriaceae bacterium VKM Ac-2854]